MTIAVRRAAPPLLLALMAACGGRSSPPGPPPPPPPPVTDGNVWQLFAPANYTGDTLAVSFPVLGAGERLAVLLVNAGGDDNGVATVTVTGTGAPDLAPAGAPLASLAGGGAVATADSIDEPFDRAAIRRGEALVGAMQEQTLAMLRDGRLSPARRTAAAAAPRLAAAIPATRSFCQGRYGAVATSADNPLGFARFYLPATRAYQSAHAAFYYANEVQAGIDLAVATRTGLAPPGVAPFWGELAAAYETRILPALTTYFGPESDVDRNGMMIFLMGNLGQIGTAPNVSFPVGYFWPGDLIAPLADGTTCPQGVYGSTGNQADMLYLMDPGSFTGLVGGTGTNYGPVLAGIVAGDYPGVMAHELQHDVNFNARYDFTAGRFFVKDEETWLNEGLSKLSETVSGYGLHTATGRSAVRWYLGEVDPVKSATAGANVLYHQGYSLTVWEGDPRGNYAGVQAYMQHLLDHASPAVIKALENPSLAGKANVAAATGVPWETGFARFVTASMFSNEDFSLPPIGVYAGTIASSGNLLAGAPYNYLGDGVGPDYVPWHHYTGYCTVGGTRYDKPRLAYVAFTPLAAGVGSSQTLRKDGWAATASGPGSGAAATVTVRSAAANRPYVVVVKYSGALPNFTPLDLTCP